MVSFKRGDMTSNTNILLDKVLALVNAGGPLYIHPYKQPKVWGVGGIGEYWYGAEAAPKSSTVTIEGDAVPMADIVGKAPEKILGEGAIRKFGNVFPLVKILTPKSRLSVQFHDVKNELWIVIGINRDITGANARLIVGFAPEAVKKYGENITREYQRALEEYGKCLNELIDIIEGKGYKDLLEKMCNVAIAAEQLKDKHPDIAEKLLTLNSRSDALKGFYNYRTVKIGDVIPIPSGTLHALGGGIEVVEPQIPGPTQSLEDGVTYPVRYYFPGYERPGAQKKLDIDRVCEMNTGIITDTPPEVIKDGKGCVIERLPGKFENKGLEVHRITMKSGSELDVPSIRSFHNLVLVSGKAKVIIKGKEYDVPKASPGGEMLIIPANTGSYRIIADEPSQIIDTFIPV